MSEETQGQTQDQGTQGDAQGDAAKGEKLSDHERVVVEGTDLVKSREDIIEAAQKHFAGEKLLDKFSQEKQKWTEEQRETLNDAKFGKVFRKAVTEKDPAALREVLIGLGVGVEEATQQVSSWEKRVAGKQPTQTQPQAQPQQGKTSVEGLLGQMADALIAVGKGQEALKGRLDSMEGGFKTLDTRDMARAEQEMMNDVETAIRNDDFHGDFAEKSPRYLGRLKKDTAAILARRLQSGERDISKAVKESLEEARAALEDYSDAFTTDSIPLSGLPSGGSALDAYRPKKAPDPVSMTDPKYGDNLMERIEAWIPELQKSADRSRE